MAAAEKREINARKTKRRQEINADFDHFISYLKEVVKTSIRLLYVLVIYTVIFIANLYIV